MLQPSFWDNRETADKLVGELNNLETLCHLIITNNFFIYVIRK